jgi:hypothetical protein
MCSSRVRMTYGVDPAKRGGFGLFFWGRFARTSDIGTWRTILDG